MSEAISVFLSSNPTDLIATGAVLLFLSFLGRGRKGRKSGGGRFNIFKIMGIGLKWTNVNEMRLKL